VVARPRKGAWDSLAAAADLTAVGTVCTRPWTKEILSDLFNLPALFFNSALYLGFGKGESQSIRSDLYVPPSSRV
jgi:hypothetical protein